MLNFLIEVPFTKEKMPWCPCSFKNQASDGIPLDNFIDFSSWWPIFALEKVSTLENS